MSIANPNVAAMPDRPSERLADTTLMLILMMASNDQRSDRALSERTLGLVGFGRVGRAVARRACLGFGMRVLAHSQSAADRAIAERLGVEWIDTLDELLFEADIVSLHCSGGGDNHHLIDAYRLNQMKPDAFLINTAHGDLVEEQALVHALWFETIGGAGIGVPLDEVQRSKELQSCDNAIVVSHPGTALPETHETAGIGVIDNVVDLFEAGRPSDRL